MGTWSNSDHSWNNDDMDSRNAAGTEAKRLRVRNTTVPTPDPAQTHRVEILERGFPLSVHNALKINGDVHLDYYGEDSQDHRAGSIEVEQAGLYINAEPEVDPAVHIGWSASQPEQHGNYLYVSANETAIGPGQSPVPGFKLTVKAPMKVEGALQNPTGNLQVEGKVAADQVDARTDGELEIGGENATMIKIADSDVQTQVEGPFDVLQDSDLHGDVTVRGTLTGQGMITGETLRGSLWM